MDNIGALLVILSASFCCEIYFAFCPKQTNIVNYKTEKKLTFNEPLAIIAYMMLLYHYDHKSEIYLHV